MIGKLNHVAIVVSDLKKSINKYKNVLGADTSDPIELPDHGVVVSFVNVRNTKIELLHPLDKSSPINKFLGKNPNGSMHHVCYEVNDIIKSKNILLDSGMKILGSGEPTIGAHGKPVIFLDPKDFDGTLIELEEI